MKGQPVYEPLVWTIAGVQVCPTHRYPLEQQCPACRQGSSWLAWHAHPGYCFHCGVWLGHAATPPGPEVEASSIHQAVLVGALLARTPRNEPVSQTHLLAALKKLVGQATEGNLAAFARLVGLTKTTLCPRIAQRGWKRKEAILRWLRSMITGGLPADIEQMVSSSAE